MRIINIFFCECELVKQVLINWFFLFDRLRKICVEMSVPNITLLITIPSSFLLRETKGIKHILCFCCIVLLNSFRNGEWSPKIRIRLSEFLVLYCHWFRHRFRFLKISVELIKWLFDIMRIESFVYNCTELLLQFFEC